MGIIIYEVAIFHIIGQVQIFLTDTVLKMEEFLMIDIQVKEKRKVFH